MPISKRFSNTWLFSIHVGVKRCWVRADVGGFKVVVLNAPGGGVNDRLPSPFQERQVLELERV